MPDLRLRLALAALVCSMLAGAGCGSPPADRDAAADASLDAGAPQETCEQNADCSASFCAPAECAPGNAEADARGCIALPAPCTVDERCDEDADACRMASCTELTEGCMAAADCDGDGRRSIACGGDDCADGDDQRYPGHAEVCDAEGHDEDCVSTTLAADSDGDRDGDGFVSASCCNGDDCGADCDDDRREVFPGASEVCNAVDDDCDGAVDEGGAFCPVGTCVERRCRALGWEKVFGSAAAAGSNVSTGGVSVDDAGNTYVVLDGAADLDDDGTAEPDTVHVVSYEADGRHRWHTAIGGFAYFGRGLAGGAGAAELAVVTAGSIRWISRADGSVVRTLDPTPPEGWSGMAFTDAAWFHGELFVLALAARENPVDPMDPPLDTGLVLLRFDAVGAETGRREIHGVDDAGIVRGDRIAVSEAGVAVTARTEVPVDLGADERVEGEIVLRLDHDFATVWAFEGLPPTRKIAIDASGAIVVVGAYEGTYVPPWGGSSWESTDGDDIRTPDTDAFVVAFSAAGEYVWHRLHDGPDYDSFGFVGFDGRDGVMVGGSFTGGFSRTPGVGGTIPAADGAAALFGVFGAADGYVLDARGFDGASNENVDGIAVDRFGNLVLLGRFFEDITLPSGTRYESTPAGPNAWAVRIADIP